MNMGYGDMAVLYPDFMALGSSGWSDFQSNPVLPFTKENENHNVYKVGKVPQSTATTLLSIYAP